MQPRQIFITLSIVVTAAIAAAYLFWPPVLWSLLLFGPLIIIGYRDILQKSSTIRRNFPLLGNLRYMLESVRPEIMQYFVETDSEGRPINRIFRSIIYQRAKNVTDTTPFGTQMNVYQSGYEWMEHSVYAKSFSEMEADPRVMVGGPDCTQPYSASILNISAMSFGSLSQNAILAMNSGAKIGNFAHNTGEGGISPYHNSPGGDLIWQIGTGYFGCRDRAGNFSPKTFEKKALQENVKMIEIKISQGAKPGHGGILPGSKNTVEIAEIRHVEPFIEIHSPPRHTAFEDAEGLMHFIKQLRELSGGKPVGFKICIGKRNEFTDICRAMISTGIKPDFITVDGGEGGTGAAPIEFSNSLGMPLRDGLTFAYDTLLSFDLKKDIKIIAAGKIITGFHIARAISLGADICNSARAMMMAVGCIQALECHLNTCPVGVATQNKNLMRGLVVPNKAQRVASFHIKTVHSFVELLAAAGLSKPEDLNRSHVNKRVNMNKVMSYAELYPYTIKGSMLTKDKVKASV